MTQILELTIDQVVGDEANVRNDVGDIDGLAQSIKHQGLLQPLLVRAAEDGTYIVVAGHRRLAAMQSIGYKDAFPVTVHETNGVSTKLAQVTENLQREDLTVWEEARAFELLRTEYGMKQKQIADMIGLDASTVSKRLKLAQLPVVAEDLLVKFEFTAEDALGVATDCASVPVEVWSAIENRGDVLRLQAAQVRTNRINTIKRAVTKAAKAAKNGRELQFVERQANVEIPEKAGKTGHVVFEHPDGREGYYPGFIINSPKDAFATKATAGVLITSHWIKPFRIDYLSAAEVDAASAEVDSERDARNKAGARRDKAHRKVQDDVMAYAFSLTVKDASALVMSAYLGELLDPAYLGRSKITADEIAAYAAVDVVFEEVEDDEDAPVNKKATSIEIAKSKRGIQACAGVALIETIEFHAISGDRKADEASLVTHPETTYPGLRTLLATGAITLPQIRA